MVMASISRECEKRLFPDFNLAKAKVSEHGVDRQTFLVEQLETARSFNKRTLLCKNSGNIDILKELHSAKSFQEHNQS